ncbi:MAG: GTP cyclohydrolase II [Magnetovibrio sp.]|nr:GTP cyclohydrolase II [Magnetovibrio sp.]
MQNQVHSTGTPHSSQAPSANIWVHRAVFELRSGRAVVIEDAEKTRILVLACEQASQERLDSLTKLSSNVTFLALSNERAKSLGLIGPKTSEVVLQSLPTHIEPQTLHRFADPLLPAPDAKGHNFEPVSITPDDGVQAAAIGLLKLAHLLPTALYTCLPEMEKTNFEGWAKEHNILGVQAADIFASESYEAETLVRVSEAAVPLIHAEQAHVIAYRPQNGGLEHLAIVIGHPQQSEKAPLIRIHSQCFTGDLLGSLRCDCGDQLRGAIQAIAKDGHGVLIYLAQEGRGIGLVNKLKAYVLQDQGADTLDANEKLGFRADERVYAAAAFMLKDLGLTKVRLLTNNPSKLDALSRADIEVVARIRHAFPSNQHNETYLQTKKDKGGHLL